MDNWKTKYLFPALGMIPIDRSGGNAGRAGARRRGRRARARRAVRHLPRGHPLRATASSTRATPAPARLALRTGCADHPGRACRAPARSCRPTRSSRSSFQACHDPLRPARSTSTATRDRADDHLVLRQIIDEVMYEIRELVGPGVRRRVRHQEGRGAPADRRWRRSPSRDRHDGARSPSGDGATSRAAERRRPIVAPTLRRPARARLPARPESVADGSSPPMADDHDHAARRIRRERCPPGTTAGDLAASHRLAAWPRPRSSPASTASSATSTWPLADGDEVAIVTERQPTGACTRCATRRPTCWPRPCSTCSPGATFAIGPPDRGRLLLRLRAARTARTFSRRRPRAHRGPHARDHRRGPAVRPRRDHRRPRRSSSSPTSRTSSRSSTGAGRRPDVGHRRRSACVTAPYRATRRDVHRPVPRPARARTPAGSATSS